jgi:hypothetical protein
MVDDWLDIVERVAILAEIVRRMGECGRTTLMKMAYLLQTVKEVPFGYDFGLYLYGPYSTQVLSDLSIAVFWDALQEEYYSTQNGYGYRITPGSLVNDLLQDAQIADLVQSYRSAIDWAVGKFRNYSASEMEAVGTLVWVDRELSGRKEKISLDKLLDIAQEIKPHFPRERFRQIAEKLIEEGVLKHVQPLHTV